MMEERRLAYQRRLLAMRSAATSLPSSQEKEFNLRIVDLYKNQPCLWNTSLPEHKDVDLKKKAWEKIAKELGSHLNAEFIRCRVRAMRYHLNVYKLQMIEYEMTPGVGKEPVKPFYVDHFTFLESKDTVKESEGEETSSKPETKPNSISEKYAKLWSDFNLKSLAKRETTAAGNSEGRRSGQSILEMVKMRMEAQIKPLEFTMPRLSITKKQQSIRKNYMLDSSPSVSSMDVLSETPPLLQAHPGDSISKTKLVQKNRDGEKPSTSKMAQAEEQDNPQSEDEELYNMHWNIRKEQRSLRPGIDQRQKTPSRPTKNTESTPDIF
ncbi:uncharacterized protein LOC108106033 [Drosophila eugracilis]|uniref:uncharacterized protein LOC108106033 n=1 Tax=Drosophila eugracilis TaxID=29029 RepID=UPI0007E7B206|nr:uncharacterized protein LOC108106033 [Drosophila eugracilis]